jgi:DNA-binding beta-propeller fold protein YncE
LGAFSYISISINFFETILHIQTSGKLYIVNKIRNIEVFNLLTVKKAEIPIDLESHEAVALSGQNKVVVTNYGTVDRDGNRIKVINTQTNKVEKTIDLKEAYLKRYRRI